MRRLAVLLTLAAALLSATTAAAALQPVRRTFGELTIPRIRAGAVHVPAGHGRGRVTVIVRLPLPPLAPAGRSLLSRRATRRLDVASSSSRAYLARLAREQRAAVAALRRAIPEATVSRRFRILLDGVTVELPTRRLPALVRLPFVDQVYPSLRYHLALNESPAIIGATAFSAATSERGEGIKIAIVDDGVDSTNPFFDPSGFEYPPGFPKGARRWTTPKVIVARAFPGPGSGRRGRLGVDRASSFHGTHVAGIAAGDAGTSAPAGPDHPAVSGLSGVAPRAWIGNYRVFTVPTSIGHVANTPEIVAAFEAAVRDGMDVINFSGGGPQTDPANDALIEAVANVAAAGVVPVIAAGNDRDDFGLGTVGSPGVAPDAISVAAVSNTHVFTPALTVVSPALPGQPREIPFVAGSSITPASWSSSGQTLVDVRALSGTDGKPVDRRLCSPRRDPNAPGSTLPAGSLKGSIALVSRGVCTFTSKARRAAAAGAAGIVFVDNRPGEANAIPIRLSIPTGMISDLDGARLREAMAARGGRARIRIGSVTKQIETGRAGIPTSFSSGGPTDFGHALKPDIAAPGGSILSSTLPEYASSPFAPLDGTSMATPHVSGAAALLIERHPTWTPRQVKSALMLTAGPAWADTTRTSEAPVLLEGAGLANLLAADDPKLFTEPQSLSFGDLGVAGGRAAARSLLLGIDDAGGGAGVWQVEVQPQAATAGASLEAPPSIELAPGGATQLSLVARASANAAAGDDYGFIVLRRGESARRVPYAFFVTRPALATASPVELKPLQLGDTRKGISRASAYRFPAAPFGPAPSYTGRPLDEDGAERVFVLDLKKPAANVGVSVVSSSRGSLIDPFVLGSLDENDVQGYAGTPVNVNTLMGDFKVNVGAAAAVFPRQQRFFVSVDSGRDEFTGASLAGSYTLRSWVNDISPPAVSLLTTRVAAGRPTLVARIVDTQSGVDPLSLEISYRGTTLGAASYDPQTGIAVFPLSRRAPELRPGRTRAMLVASDLQETKNVNTSGADTMPNTTFRASRIDVVDGPAVSWLAPEARSCALTGARLLVAASATEKIRSVRFLDGGRTIAMVRRGSSGLFSATWKTAGATPGRHLLSAVVTGANGARVTARRIVRSCRAFSAPPRKPKVGQSSPITTLDQGGARGD